MTSNVSDEPTNPEWPGNIFIFDESMSAEEIKEKILPTEDARISYKKGSGKTSETYTTKNHFHTRHYALLFKPGTYEDCKFEIGYYVQMAGLGKSPTEVKFTGGQSGPFVEALNKDMPVVPGGSIAQQGSGLNLDTFWRSVENFSAEECQWAVSQAAPLRNAHIEKDLICGDGAAWSSGGFCSNLKVGGEMNFASNQQWFTRNAEFGTEAKNGAWNTTFSGCTGNVPTPGLLEDNPHHVITVEDVPELRVEKPFITVKIENGEDFYELVVPSPANTAEDLVGPKIDGKFNDIRSFSHVKVCKPFLPTSNTPPPEWDTFNDPLKKEEIRKVLYLREENLAKIGEEYYVDHDDGTYNDLESRDDDLTKDLQKALDEKKDLVLCPGIFFLTKPLIVSHPNQVILGLGLATLIAPQDGSPCIRVEPNVPGVRIAGVTLEGSLQRPNETEYNEGPKNEDGERSLIDVGKPGVEDAGDKTNPVVLSDIFTRVGGSNCERDNVETDVMVRIHSGNVKGDNLWLWRADHVRLKPAGYGDNENKEEANDENLPYYYQVEKGQCGVKNAIKVNGNDVKMYGLFCEHTTEHQMVWNGDRGTVNFFQCEIAYDVDESYGERGYAGYYVNPDVENHTGRGIGVYSNFKKYDVKVPHGVIIPKKSNVRISTPFSRFLNNLGGITKVINVVGNPDQAYGEMVDKENPHSHGWIGFGPHEDS